MGPGRSQFSWDAAALTPPSNFEAISSRFERFWAILGGFERFCAGSECFPARLSMRRVFARGEGQGMGQPAQQVLEYLLVWIGPASIGEIHGIFMESLNCHGVGWDLKNARSKVKGSYFPKTHRISDFGHFDFRPRNILFPCVSQTSSKL
jgi:hypothetical protein